MTKTTPSAKDVQLMKAAQALRDMLNPRFIEMIIAIDPELIIKYKTYAQKKTGLIRRLRPKQNKSNIQYAKSLMQLSTEWSKSEAEFIEKNKNVLFSYSIKQTKEENAETMIEKYKNTLGLE